MTYDEAKTLISSVKRTCRGQLVNPIDRDGARLHCGFDFNQVVLSFPFDGQERDYECPKCEVKGTFRSPVIEVG